MDIIIKLITDHPDTLLTVTVTIIGFIVSTISTKKNFKNEVLKTKIESNTENLKEIPYQLLVLMEKINNSNSLKTLSKTYQDMMFKIVAYGSKDAIKIATCLQQSFYDTEEKDKTESFKQLVLFSLLISQIKFDISSEIISPLYFFKLKLTDYTDNEAILKEIANDQIDKLNLNSKFKC